MFKLALTWLVAILVIATVAYLSQPVGAVGRVEPAARSEAFPTAPVDGWSREGVWPPPREPVDTTPITPFETVGGAPDEP